MPSMVISVIIWGDVTMCAVVIISLTVKVKTEQ